MALPARVRRKRQIRETKKGLVLSGTHQDTLQAHFGDDVTTCFGKRVQLDPTPLRVAGRELVVIRLKPAPTAAPAGSNGTEPQPAAMASS